VQNILQRPMHVMSLLMIFVMTAPAIVGCKESSFSGGSGRTGASDASKNGKNGDRGSDGDATGRDRDGNDIDDEEDERRRDAERNRDNEGELLDEEDASIQRPQLCSVSTIKFVSGSGTTNCPAQMY